MLDPKTFGGIESTIIHSLKQSLLPGIRIEKKSSTLFYDEHYNHLYKKIKLKVTYKELMKCLNSSKKLYYYESTNSIYVGPDNGIGFVYYQFYDDIWFGKFPANRDFDKDMINSSTELRKNYIK